MKKVFGFIVAIAGSVIAGLILFFILGGEDGGGEGGGTTIINPPPQGSFLLDLKLTPMLDQNEIRFRVQATPGVEKEVFIQRSITGSGNWTRATSVKTSSSGSEASVNWDLNGLNGPPLYFQAVFLSDVEYEKTESNVVGPVNICPRVSICP